MSDKLDAGTVCQCTVTIAGPTMSVASAALLVHARHLGCRAGTMRAAAHALEGPAHARRRWP